MRHKILAVLLSAAISVTALPTSAAAADGVTLAAASVSAECKAGTEISVPVIAEQNAGYAAGAVDITWDSTALTLKSVAYSENAPAIDPPEITAQGSYRALFGEYQAAENFKASGEFFTMTFTVAKTAKPGDYSVILGNAALYNANLDAVPVSLKAGTVSLKGDAPADSLLLEVGSAEVTVGDDSEIRLQVITKQNPGFAAGSVDVLWDSAALTLSKISFGKIAPNNGSATIVSDGNYRIMFGDNVAKQDMKDSGVMFTLVFKANPTAPAGKYEIMLGNPNVYQVKLNAVPVTVKAGAVVLKEQSTSTAAVTGITGAMTDTTTSAAGSTTANPSTGTTTTATGTTTTVDTIESATTTDTTTGSTQTSDTTVSMTDTTITSTETETVESTTTTDTTTVSFHTSDTTVSMTDTTTISTDIETTETTAVTDTTTVSLKETTTTSTDTETMGTTTVTDTTTGSTQTSDTTVSLAETTITMINTETTGTSMTTEDTTTSLTEITESTSFIESETSFVTTSEIVSVEYDLNGDNEVTIADAILLIRFLAEDSELTKGQIDDIMNASIPCKKSGFISLVDYRALLHILAS